MSVTAVRDSLFFLAHNDEGRLLIGDGTLSTGLAGATLIDLLVSGMIVVADSRLSVADDYVLGPLAAAGAADAAGPTGDREVDAALVAIASSQQPAGPRAWVSWLAPGAYERVASILEESGRVVRTAQRRLGFVSTALFRPADHNQLVRIRAQLRYAVGGDEQPDAFTAALCGLVRVLRLERSLLLPVSASQLLLGLERTSVASQVPVRQVTNAVESVVQAGTYHSRDNR